MLNNISELAENTKKYIEARLDLFALTTVEKISAIISFIISRIILIVIFSFAVFFISIGLALWLGSLLNSYVSGFFVVSLFYIIFALIIYFFRKELIDKSIIKSIFQIFFSKENNNKN